MFFGSRSSALAAYKKCRQATMAFHTELCERYVHDRKEVFERAVRELNMGDGRTIVLDCEQDLSVLMDYALHEVPYQGKNAIQWAIDDDIAANDSEREILAALANARLCLTEVESIDSSNSQVTLRNVIVEQQSITLTDIGLSRSTQVGNLLALRPLVFSTHTMTSGVTFPFRPARKRRIMKQWNQIKSRAARYQTFFQLSKREGFNMLLI